MRQTLPLPSQVRLKELLDYDHLTGIFRWRCSGKGRPSNLLAGPQTSGYRTIVVDKIGYGSHRLAWMWFYGEDPGDMMVDHKNQQPGDDWIENLRLATHGQNQTNSRLAKNNKSGFKGVHWAPRHKKWRVYVYHQKLRHDGGMHREITDANIAARALRERLHGEFSNHGS